MINSVDKFLFVILYSAYPVSPAPTEKLIADPRYDEAIKELRKIWKDELNISASDNKQVIHSINKRLRDDEDDDDYAKMKKAKKIKRNK